MAQNQDTNQSDSGIVQGLALAGGGTLVGGGIIAALLAPQYRSAIFIFLAVALVLVIVSLGIFLLVRTRRRKKQAADMAAAIPGSMDEAASSHEEPEVKARLERIKRKFMDLITTLRSEGSNIYELPWFLTLGPSGSGKSWVLKGAGLNPLGDEPWKGGTFLIDWWTCPEAIVLDTAGGVVFHEQKGYETPEWGRLLELLKKHRPQCPISGVLVMVPAQLLWLRDEELPEGWLTLDEYSTALRMQLRRKLQRDLGVRFPVYFLVTQTDRVPGFREFTEALEDNGKPKGQMVGWSLPVLVGQQPHRKGSNGGGEPELEQIKALEESLRGVASDMRRQRLLLLRKYVGESARGDELGMSVRRRAADLFAFPDAMQNTLAPRLQELVEKVFKPDPVLPKAPPFLRGVYFTSSMREGEVLDRNRAGGVGRSMASIALPGGADNQQPNPFFLKDLIGEKVFPESGLVMPLEQARAFLKQRRRLLIWSGIGAAALLLLAIGLGGYSYNQSVGSELRNWEDAGTTAKINPTNYWLPVVSGAVGNVQLESTNLAKQLTLASAAHTGVNGNGFWSFGWLFRMHKLDTSRRAAQLHVFERGVIWPMADLARQKLLASTDDAKPIDQARLADERSRFEAGLCAVLELELNTNRNLKTPVWEASRDRVLDGLVAYVLAGQTSDAQSQMLGKLKNLFNVTYQQQADAWPPTRYKQPGLLTSLVDNSFHRLKQLQANQSDLLNQQRGQLRSLIADSQSLKDSEASLLSDIENRDSVDNLTDKLHTLQSGWQKLAPKLAAAQVLDFRSAFTNFAVQVKTNAEEGQAQFRLRLMDVNDARQGTNLIPLLAEGFTNLASDVPQLETSLKSFRDLWEQAAVLDATVVGYWKPRNANGQETIEPRRLLEQRLAVYESILNLTPPSTRQWERNLFEEGTDPKEVLEKFQTMAGQACGPFQTGACAGLTNGAVSFESTLCQYVEFRYLEALLKAAEKATETVLGSGDFAVEINGGRNPAAMLNETSANLARLKSLDSAWASLKDRWQTLGGREALLIRRSAQRINETRTRLLDSISQEIQTEDDGPKKFPLVARGEAALSESELSKYRKRAKSWLDTLQNTTPETKSIPADSRSGWVKIVNDDWLPRLDPLVDDDGNLRDYEIRTPWGKDSDAFKNYLRDDPAFNAAKEAAGTYRFWTIYSKQIDASDPDQSIQVNAADGFALDAKGKDGSASQIGTSIRNDSWSIIAMLNLDPRSHRAPYFVPIEVSTGGKQSAKVWFVVRPVATKNPH